jgi:hypothetical protein
MLLARAEGKMNGEFASRSSRAGRRHSFGCVVGVHHRLLDYPIARQIQQNQWPKKVWLKANPGEHEFAGRVNFS